MKLTGKKALITGDNSGIGLAKARLFIAEGAQVAITGRDQKTLDEAIAELGSSARGYRTDVTVAEDRERLFAALAKDFGKLGIVFANAGISDQTPTGSADEAVFENVIRTNLNGVFFTVNSAAPLLKDNGSIIFNGSVHNYLAQPGQAAYTATKGGLVSRARAIAADLAPRNIRVNVVAPGATKTPIWKRGARASVAAEDSAKLAKFVPSVIPLGRWGEPEELAKAVLFLASEDSSCVKRSRADGGWWGHGRPVRGSHSSQLNATVLRSSEAKMAKLKRNKIASELKRGSEEGIARTDASLEALGAMVKYGNQKTVIATGASQAIGTAFVVRGPSVCFSSSQGLGWNNLAIERHLVETGEKPETRIAGHQITLASGPHVACESVRAEAVTSYRIPSRRDP